MSKSKKNLKLIHEHGVLDLELIFNRNSGNLVLKLKVKKDVAGFKRKDAIGFMLSKEEAADLAEALEDYPD